MKRVLLSLPEGYLTLLDKLVERHFFPNRSEAMRAGIRDMLKWYLGENLVKEANTKP